MKRAMAVTGVLVALALALTTGPLGADSERPPDIKQIMKKLNDPTGLHPTLGKELKDDEPAWDDIQKETKEFTAFAAALGKNNPPKGSKESWTKLTAAYADNAKALDDAAQKKDKKAALAAYNKLGMDSCKACHPVHRVRKS